MLEGYAEAAEAVTGLVERIPDDAWDGPGLGEWDLRALVGHTSRSFVTVLTYLDRPAETEDIDSPEGYYALLPSMTGEGLDQAAVAQRGRDAGVALGDDPAAAFASLAERAVAAARAADPDMLIASIAGGLRVASYVPTRTIELVVHGNDIAAATGLDVTFSTHTTTQVATVLARTAVRLGHGGLLLRALTGRAALPPGFSVV
ncbi:maleylpyruvate isomerase N-terminal domain-containing protein [Actinomycetospora lemnae]|uniref:Maleylpyruvate isomerase N-terminal domain-containing protein n=1 Tax=Actinomycetospora lemnae TaxID=3019891 RepID=A0ABT5SXI2_9PSEU|nr:maleylpyruvate isomerase N-terminal domain-containing protein [Actinomycetospora sp. DW7H6]MDD7967568.1 maleylpyruvate isomerase N-terminal domain-containing protein [Actinomycetospora sp. DW7H6]